MPTNNAPAISDPQKYTSPRMRSVATPRGTGFWSEMETYTSAYRKSCIVSVNAKMTAVKIPAMLTGRTTRISAANGPHPSTRAASSISGGTVLKNPLSSQVQYGIVNVGYTRTRAHLVSMRWEMLTTRDRGMNKRTGGMRYPRKIPIPMFSAPGNPTRASAYPAGTAAARVTTDTQKAIAIVL